MIKFYEYVRIRILTPSCLELKKNGDLIYKCTRVSTVVLHWCQVFSFSLILSDKHTIRTFLLF